MLRYFSLLQKGWDSKDALVWYATGGDVYYLQFVVQAGVADKIMRTLGKALQTAKTESVRARVQAIEGTVRGEIEKYKTFVKEEAIARYCGLGEEQIVSEEQMDFLHNANSVWTKTVPIKVLRDYGTMAFYPEQADFSCRMLYDEKNMYIGYAVFDDNLQEKRKQADGSERYFRTDGSELIAYAETYIGGNAFNRTVYYGYISGFMGEKNEKGQFYENAGSPKGKPIPEGVRDVRFVSLSDNPKERYHFHVQVIPFLALNVAADMATPYGSFVYYTNRFGRAGWMGYGLWSKQNFQSFTLLDRNK